MRSNKKGKIILLETDVVLRAIESLQEIKIKRGTSKYTKTANNEVEKLKRLRQSIKEGMKIFRRRKRNY